MNKSILRNLTWEDINEIVVAVYRIPTCDMDAEHYYKSVLAYLRNENNIPPPIEETYPKVLQAAEQATSWMLTDSRERENTLIRSFVAYKLHKDGYSYAEIGKIMKRDHSTITHLANRMRDMLSLPNAYKWEVQQYKRFEEMLCG